MLITETHADSTVHHSVAQAPNPWGLGKAVFSDDLCYRYALGRGTSLAPAGRVVHWIMLNPSTADASQNDPTIRQVIKFSRRWGFRALTVHNLFAVRATDPRKLKELPDPVGPENHTQISLMAELAAAYKEPVICAWGNHGGYMDQANTALGWLDHAGLPPRLIQRLGPLTKAKQPRHPLFTAIDTPRERLYDIDP